MVICFLDNLGVWNSFGVDERKKLELHSVGC